MWVLSKVPRLFSGTSFKTCLSLSAQAVGSCKMERYNIFLSYQRLTLRRLTNILSNKGWRKRQMRHSKNSISFIRALLLKHWLTTLTSSAKTWPSIPNKFCKTTIQHSKTSQLTVITAKWVRIETKAALWALTHTRAIPFLISKFNVNSTFKNHSRYNSTSTVSNLLSKQTCQKQERPQLSRYSTSLSRIMTIAEFKNVLKFTMNLLLWRSKRK